MANTTKVNKTRSVNNRTKYVYSETTINSNSIEKTKICKCFTKLTYISVIIGAIFYLLTMVTLFGASIGNKENWWLGFWTQCIKDPIPPASLSILGIITIIFDCLWLLLFIIHTIGNLILKNKIKLSHVTKISIALSVTIFLMIILGACCKPIYAINSEALVFYISWMQLITSTSGYSTVLTSGAIFILLELIFVYLGCIAYIIYYYILKAKKNK